MAAPLLAIRGSLPIAIGLPAVVAAVNHALLLRFAEGSHSIPEIALTYALFVLQVGVAGVLVARHVDAPWLRGTLLLWMLLLVDLQVTAMNNMCHNYDWTPQSGCLAAGLFAGQFGLVAVWAVFGSGRWFLRWPAMLLAAWPLAQLWNVAVPGLDGERWTWVLATHSAAMIGLCAAMSHGGFRLKHQRLCDRTSPPTDALEPMQFRIAHVLAWTTALALALGAARSLDLLNLEAVQKMLRPEISFAVSLGILSAMVAIVALWTALGDGDPFWRYLILALTSLAIGGVVAWFCLSQISPSGRFRNSGAVWAMRQWREIGWWWLAWMPLVAAFLVASLLFLRGQGYRLVRKRRYERRGLLAAVQAMKASQ